MSINLINSAAANPMAQKPEGVNQELPKNTDAELVKKIAGLEIRSANIEDSVKPSRAAVASAAADIEKFVKDMGRKFSFSVDDATGYNVVKVIDPDTNELIRQLPSEELLKIARSMKEMGNVLVSQKA